MSESVLSQIARGPDLTATAGPDLGKMLSLQAFMQQTQEHKQEVQRQNTLRQILGTPGAIDPTTGVPTPRTMGAVMAVDPNTGMKLQEHTLQLQGERAKAQKAQLDRYGEIQDIIHPIRTQALAAYQAALPQGQEAANKAGQSVLDEQIPDVISGGQLTPEESKQVRTKFDYPTMAGADKQWQDMQAKRRDETRKDVKLGLDIKKADTPPAGQAQARDVEVVADAKISDMRAEAKAKNQPPPTAAEEAAARLQVRATSGKAAMTPAAQKEKDIETLATAQFRTTHDGRDPGPEDAAEVAKLKQAERSRSSPMSGRNAQLVGRSLTSAADAVSDIRNVMELPITIDTGIFGGRRQGPGLMAATKEILANKVTDEDAQAYNTAMAGLERSLGGLATGGLAVSDQIMNQFGKLEIVKGDTNLIKLRKIATMRQNVDNGLDGLLSNPQLGDAQKKMIDDLQAKIAEAVPFTVHDVNQVEFGKNPKLTVGQFAKQHGVDKTTGGQSGGASSGALPPAATDAGAKPPQQTGDVYRDVTKEQYDLLPHGAWYTMPGDPPGHHRTKM